VSPSRLADEACLEALIAKVNRHIYSRSAYDYGQLCQIRLSQHVVVVTCHVSQVLKVIEYTVFHCRRLLSGYAAMGWLRSLLDRGTDARCYKAWANILNNAIPARIIYIYYFTQLL